jgi:glycerol-3-phosphate acyltransferase PlsY
MLWLSGAALVVGYLVGSLPTAYLAARRAARRFTDIRDLGDGNSGAGNMGRIYGRGWGIAVGVVDIAKGIAPVFAFNILVSLISTDPHEPAESLPELSGPGMLAGASAMAGHIWPVWLRFRGGRGAATALGVTTAVLMGPVLLMGLPALVILWTTRSTTITLAFVYIASIIIAKAIFDISWSPIWYCVAIFVVIGLVHFWTLKYRTNPSVESIAAG